MLLSKYNIVYFKTNMKIVVASKNPVKINAALQGFKTVFPNTEFVVEGVSVPSNVADQPMDESETMTGAMNRVDNAKNTIADADYWVGIEGGVAGYDDEMITFAWVYIKDKNELLGKGRSASFFLPKQVVSLIKQGKELGEADDIVFAKSNSKQKNGAVGILTKDIITRESLYVPAVIMALIPFINVELYK